MNESDINSAGDRWEEKFLEIRNLVGEIFDEVERVYPGKGFEQRYALKEECKQQTLSFFNMPLITR